MEPSWIYATPPPMPFTNAPYQYAKGLKFERAVTALGGRKVTLLQTDNLFYQELGHNFCFAGIPALPAGVITVVLGSLMLASPFSQELPLETAGFDAPQWKAQPKYITSRRTPFDTLPGTNLPVTYGILYPAVLWGAVGLCCLAHSEWGLGNRQRDKVISDINRLILSLGIFKDSRVLLPESRVEAFYQYFEPIEKTKLNFAQLSALYDSDYTVFKADLEEGLFSQSQRCYWRFYEHFRKASPQLQNEMLISKRNIILLAEEPLLFERVVRAAHDPQGLIPILSEIFDRNIVKQLGTEALSTLIKVIVKGSSFLEAVSDIASSCKMALVEFTSGDDTILLPHSIIAEYFPHFKCSHDDQIALPEGISLSNLRAFVIFVAQGKVALAPSIAGEDPLDSEGYQLLKVACFFNSQEHSAVLIEQLKTSFARMLRYRTALQLLEIFTQDGLQPLISSFESYYSQTHLKTLIITDEFFHLLFQEAFERPDLPICKKACQVLLESDMGLLSPPNDGSAAAKLIHNQTLLLNKIPNEQRLKLDPKLETVTENWIKQHPKGIEDFWQESIELSSMWLQKVVHNLYRDHPEYFVHTLIPCELESVFIV